MVLDWLTLAGVVGATAAAVAVGIAAKRGGGNERLGVNDEH